MSRLIQVGLVVKGQLDFYVTPGEATRVTGLTADDVEIVLFKNNSLTSWAVVDGSSVLDSSISAGIIYFNEIDSAPGYYSVRFYPDSTGFWRLGSVYNDREQVLEFDLTSSSSLIPTNDGFITSFTG
jgi:hypothetical protein